MVVMLGVGGSSEMYADWKLEPVGCCGHVQIRSLHIVGFISTLSSMLFPLLHYRDAWSIDLFM
jgi:hypothetical protein